MTHLVSIQLWILGLLVMGLNVCSLYDWEPHRPELEGMLRSFLLSRQRLLVGYQLPDYILQDTLCEPTDNCFFAGKPCICEKPCEFRTAEDSCYCEINIDCAGYVMKKEANLDFSSPSSDNPFSLGVWRAKPSTSRSWVRAQRFWFYLFLLTPEDVTTEQMISLMSLIPPTICPIWNPFTATKLSASLSLMVQRLRNYLLSLTPDEVTPERMTALISQIRLDRDPSSNFRVENMCRLTGCRAVPGFLCFCKGFCKIVYDEASCDCRVDLVCAGNVLTV